MAEWIQTHIDTRNVPTQYIPRILHLVWVGNAARPESLDEYIVHWGLMMPHWKIRLWTNDDLNDTEIEPNVLARIREAKKGTQKADILKYYVVHKYGGVYLDADVEPTRSLEPLIYMSDLVICHHNEITWPYIAVGFFAASPNHPVLKKAIEICMTTTLNTPEPNMTTGPGAFGLAVSETPPPSRKYTNIPLDCFYWPEGGMTPNRFGRHLFARNWEE